MSTESRDQSLPPHVKAATSYVLVPGAHNTSAEGTLRAGRWDTIVKYSNHPDGIAAAKRESGVTKRHLYLLERDGQLRLNTSTTAPRRDADESARRLTPALIAVVEDEESRFPEGAARYRMHREFERDSAFALRAKALRVAESGRLACDVCGFDFAKRYGDRGAGFIEAHHTVPVSELRATTTTKLSDLALVCSNCHRMLHRGPRLLTVEQLKAAYDRASGT